jgi:hypothetical protein
MPLLVGISPAPASRRRPDTKVALGSMSKASQRIWLGTCWNVDDEGEEEGDCGVNGI